MASYLQFIVVFCTFVFVANAGDFAQNCKKPTDDGNYELESCVSYKDYDENCGVPEFW